MSSILTNASAMSALATLRSINEQLDTTQNRISSGLRVAHASDNAAYWSIATNMRSQNKSLSAVQDTLGLGSAVVNVASTGLEQAIDLTTQIQAKYVAYAQLGDSADETAEGQSIQDDIAALKQQVKNIAAAAEFQGHNLLNADGGGDSDLTLVTGINAAGTVATSTIASYNLGTALDSVTDAASTATALEAMNAAAATLGTAKTSIDSQADFTKALMDSIDKGIGQLVDADMNEESTRLKALQTQQQLGIQALSIANSSPQSILQLFR